MAAPHRRGPTPCGHRGRETGDRAARIAPRLRVSAHRDTMWARGARAGPRLRGDRMLVQQLAPDPRDDLSEPGAILEVREDEWALAAHQLCVTRHHVEARADVRGEI